MNSILQDKRECWVCHTTFDLHEHHVFEGWANRRQSEKTGMKVFLCARHHNMSNEGVHFNKELDTRLKIFAQTIYEETHSREEFRQVFGKSWR